MSYARSLRLFLSGYGLLVLAGTVLLLLPGVAVTSEGLSFFNALFTAVSAVCLAGLTVVNTATYFTFFGQAMVLLLIQAGALFYLFFAVQLVRQRSRPSWVEGASEGDSSGDLLKRIIGITALVETGAFLLIFYAWGNYEFEGVGHKVFVTVFHAISAFCNAGFSVLDENLFSVRRAFVLHLVLLAAYVLGGLGMDTLYDLFSPKRLRQRLANPSIDWRPGTKVSVNTSMILLGVGGLVFYLLEQYNTLNGLNLTEKLIGSLFQSATARTAGFYTVDITQLTHSAMLVMTVLMLVGGGAGSTAGGIKTATLYHMLTFWQDDKRTDVGIQPLPVARWVTGYALLVNGTGVLVLYFTETDQQLVLLVFEQVSAFSSVGLSPVTTATLSPAGQGVLLLSMLLGRVGILTLMMALAQRRSTPL